MATFSNEWHVEKGDQSAKYIVYVDNLDKKIKTFQTGQEISSRIFKIGDSALQVVVYPGGETTFDQSHVTVSLRNRGSHAVSLKTSFTLLNTDIQRSIDKKQFQTTGIESSWSISRFLHHDRCQRNGLLSNGVLGIEVNIDVAEVDVVSSQTTTVNDEAKKLRSLEQTVSFQMQQICQIKELIEKQEMRSQTQAEELQTMIRGLSYSMRRTSDSNSCSTARANLNCPVCLEEVRPPMRLKQCGQGHIICDSCHEFSNQTQSSGRCATCREKITGRPIDLERILGLV